MGVTTTPSGTTSDTVYGPGRAAAKFEVYIDRKGGHRWRLKASNGEIIATGEAYTTTTDAKRGVEAVRRAAAGAVIAVLPTQ